jgi:general secretion pathway protein F
VLGFLYRKQLKNIIFDLMLYFKKFKDLVINLQLSYFFGAFSLMLSGGIDIKKALKLSSKIITYPELKSLILKTHEELKRGQKLSDSFSGSDLIDVNTVSLIAAGENSATLPEVFDSLSKRYLKEFQNKTKSLLSLLEPAVIIIMGGVIAVIVVSIMLAVMSISDITG